MKAINIPLSVSCFMGLSKIARYAMRGYCSIGGTPARGDGSITGNCPEFLSSSAQYLYLSKIA
jgi:hypothetical protein